MLSSTATTTIDRDETEELGKALGLDFALTFLFLPRPFASANKPAEEDPPEKVLLDAKKIDLNLIKKEFDDEGKLSDGMSGMRLSYFGARYYDAEVGVWTSVDPMEQYWSRYSYVGGNPVNAVDPTGALAIPMYLPGIGGGSVGFGGLSFGGTFGFYPPGTDNNGLPARPTPFLAKGDRGGDGDDDDGESGEGIVFPDPGIKRDASGHMFGDITVFKAPDVKTSFDWGPGGVDGFLGDLASVAADALSVTPGNGSPTSNENMNHVASFVANVLTSASYGNLGQHYSDAMKWFGSGGRVGAFVNTRAEAGWLKYAMAAPATERLMTPAAFAARGAARLGALGWGIAGVGVLLSGAVSTDLVLRGQYGAAGVEMGAAIASFGAAGAVGLVVAGGAGLAGAAVAGVGAYYLVKAAGNMSNGMSFGNAISPRNIW